MNGLNPNLVILGIFTAAGVAVAAWGWAIIARGRRMRHWPSAAGVIEESSLQSEEDDLLPRIVYRYTVDGAVYRQPMRFPGSVTPNQEFAAAYVRKYPSGAQVQVHYDPADPENSTLEPDLGRGDWMIVALGVAAAVFGGVFLLISV